MGLDLKQRCACVGSVVHQLQLVQASLATLGKALLPTEQGSPLRRDGLAQELRLVFPEGTAVYCFVPLEAALDDLVPQLPG
jgi:hypothetical protein